MALELLDLDHRYGRHRSLQRVSLRLERGDCYGFLGHNGAGKTTTLRIALGLDQPRHGSVRVDGFDALRWPREARARIGGTIETTAFYDRISAQDNLIGLARLQGMVRHDARAEALRSLDLVGLTEHARRPVRAFSQGMRQRLGIAQALLGNPAYVLLDEPHNGLDPEGVAELRTVLRRLVERGEQAVLVSSHQLAEVAELCNRVGILREGQLLLEQSTDELLRASRSRFRVETDNADATRTVVQRLGGRPLDLGVFDLGRVEPRALVRELVGAGIAVDEIARQPATLEEIYLGLRSPTPATARARSTSPAPSAPSPRIAPSRPALRIWSHDLRRYRTRVIVLTSLTVPSLLAWRRILQLREASQRHLAELEQGDLFSTSTVTAFEALGRGLIAGLPALTVIAAVAGSQAIAGERSRGTLRNLLLQPLRRGQLVAGKALAVATAALLSLGVLLATSCGLAAAWFDFGDRSEVYREGEPDLLIGAADVWPDLSPALWGTALPVLGYASVGLLLGVMIRRNIWSLLAALTAVAALDFGRAIARPRGLESYLLSAHQPSPMGDTSYLAYFVDLSVGNAEAFYEFGNKLWLVPATWTITALGLAALLFSRQRIR